jgi:hypothetical protein
MVSVPRNQIYTTNSVYSQYIYVREGLQVQNEATERVTLVVPKGRLMAGIRCYETLCVGQTRQDLDVNGDIYQKVTRVFPNGIYYYDIRMLSSRALVTTDRQHERFQEYLNSIVKLPNVLSGRL